MEKEIVVIRIWMNRLVPGIRKDMTFKAVFLTGKNSCKGAKKSLNRDRLLINLSARGFANVQSMLGHKIWGNVLHCCFIKKYRGTISQG